jgi:uncharacterized surface protein with fasciclin (FAS1) repeats
MKVDTMNLLTKLVSILGVTGASACFSMVASANEVINPNPSIFQENPYSRSQRIQVNSQYTPNAITEEETKNQKPNKKRVVAQGKAALNPKPSILDECPYNRSACANRTPSPETTPTTPDSTSTPEVTPTPDTTVPTSPAPESTTPSKTPTTSTEGKNVVAIAESNPSFSILTKALKAAGLTQTLEGKGPFTVFAPTDEAFGKLPQDALQDLLKPENKEVLVKILTYHVVPGNVESSQLKAGEIKTLQGDAVNIKIGNDKGVMVNDAKVVKPDIKATNGNVHVIDTVMIPPSL